MISFSSWDEMFYHEIKLLQFEHIPSLSLFFSLCLVPFLSHDTIFPVHLPTIASLLVSLTLNLQPFLSNFDLCKFGSLKHLAKPVYFSRESFGICSTTMSTSSTEEWSEVVSSTFCVIRVYIRISQIKASDARGCRKEG